MVCFNLASPCLSLLLLAICFSAVLVGAVVPPVRWQELPVTSMRQYTEAIAVNLAQLYTPGPNLHMMNIPLGDLNRVSDQVRKQLQDRGPLNHLLYLGHTMDGHVYAFPLEGVGDEGQSRVRMALLTVSKRPRKDAYDVPKPIQFHGLVAFDVPNRNIFFHSLQSARGNTYGSGPMTHDIVNLMSDQIHGF